MSRAPHRPEDETVAYHGEVWTNAGGYATVELPPDAALLPPLAYDLRDLDPPSTAHIVVSTPGEPDLLYVFSAFHGGALILEDA